MVARTRVVPWRWKLNNEGILRAWLLDWRQVRQDELKILSGLQARVAGCVALGSHIVT